MSPGREASEDHATGRRLQYAGHGNTDFLTDSGPALLHDDHGAVIQVADALADLVARLDHFDDHRFAGQGDGLHSVGHFIEVNDFHALQLGDLVQVKVIRDHSV